MRLTVLAAVIFLSACAGEQQSSAPPAGVDFSGQWKLNAADSDDPTHLAQAASGQAGGTRGGGSGGQGGRGEEAVGAEAGAAAATPRALAIRAGLVPPRHP